MTDVRVIRLTREELLERRAAIETRLAGWFDKEPLESELEEIRYLLGED